MAKTSKAGMWMILVVLSMIIILPSSIGIGEVWTQATANPGWSERMRHTSVVFDNKLWVIGGENPSSLNDVWYSSDGVTWTQATASAPWSPRYAHASVVFNGNIWVIGGRTGLTSLNDVWYSSDGVNWNQAPNLPAGRSGMSAVVFNSKIWLIGGVSGIIYRNNVWYSSDGVTWTQATASAPWIARWLHSSVVFDNKIWVIGGFGAVQSNNQPLGDVWYSSNGVNWIEATASAEWSARADHSSVVFDNKIWVMGGMPIAGTLNDVWYSTDGITWTQTAVTNPFTLRGGHSSEVFDAGTGEKIWVIGGGWSPYRNDVWYSGIAPQAEDCTNSIDDDGDGDTDCTDSDCAADPACDLVLHLKFDEGSGTTAYDSSGYSNDGTIYGASWINGLAGSALSFDGINDYVEIPDSDSLDLTDEITIVVWYKKPDNRNGGILQKYNSYYTYFGGGASALGYVLSIGGVGHGGGAGNFFQDEWAYAVMTYDGSTIKTYLNGVQQVTSAVSGTLVISTNNIIIGNNNLNWYFNGMIDEIRIYKRALTFAEISDLFLSFCVDSDEDGYSLSGTDCGPVDCDDADISTYPGATEICDSKDNHCPGDAGYGAVDEGCVAPPTCSDSIQNQDETGVDCGGTVCSACPPLPGTCSSLGGSTCNFAEICKGGNMVAADDTNLCCTGAAASCARGIFDISDADFTICHDESCMQVDYDNDGIYDIADNCAPLTYCPDNYADCYNPNQADIDGNGIGDACDCVVPHDDLHIIKDTTLCPGIYNIVDANEDGVIIFDAGSIKLDCNGASLVSSAECSMPGDVNRNSHIDAEDGLYISDAISSIAEYNQCIADLDSCRQDCDVNFAGYGYATAADCYADCTACGEELNVQDILDPCMDANQDGALDSSDVAYIDDNMQCPQKGDLDYSGKIDYMDIYLEGVMSFNGMDNQCADANNDGQVETGSDISSITNTISSESVRECDGVVCNDINTPGGCCPAGQTAACFRNSEKQLLGDLDYDGKYSSRDIFLSIRIISSQLPTNFCMDLNDGFTTSLDLAIFRSIVIGVQPYINDPVNYPRAACDTRGDMNGDGYLSGLDLFLCSEVSNNINSYGSNLCCDMNSDGLINNNDILAFINKLRGRKGTGIMAQQNDLLITNCVTTDYENGISMLSSNSLVTRNLLNNTNDLYIGAGSSGNNIYLNHFYKSGVTDLGSNNYCMNNEGDFYWENIGAERIASSDCGPSILDPSLNGITRRPEGTIALSWTRQSSLFPVTYSVSYMMDGDASWTSITPSIAGLAYNWDVTGMPVGSYTVRLIPNDGRVNGTINTIRIIITENGRIDGYVTCGEDAVAGATVLVQGYPVTTVTTGNDGHYTITNAPVNSHEVVAYDEGRTTRQLPYSLDPTSLQPQTTVDFSNVCPVTLDCEADCTIVGGDICTAECNGVSGCSMNPLCVNVKSGLMIDYNETTRMRCCSGEFVPVSMEETRVELGADIEAEDITRTTRIVYYDGKPVKMIITVWE